MNIKKISEYFDVSASTVSRALSPETEQKVAPKMRERIQRYAREHGFAPNRAARELVTGKTRVLGVILPVIYDSLFYIDYLAKASAGIQKALDDDRRYQLKLLVLPRGKSLSELQERELLEGVDGLIISACCDPLLYRSHYLPEQFKSKRPVVIMNLNGKPSKNIHFVYSDNRQAAFQGTSYLVRRGHRLIAMIQGDPKAMDAKERYAGYQQALKAHRLPFRESLVREGGFTYEGAYQGALSLLSSVSKPTAIFCANDEMALGAMEALRSLGLRCPQDVAILGMDGLHTAQFTTPPLSTMAQPIFEIAHSAAQILISAIEGKIQEPIRKEIPMEFISRNSI